jgi:multidrug efflux pump subunit AcrA (membrane-fusion protein)
MKVWKIMLVPLIILVLVTPAACTTASSQQTSAMQQVQTTRGDLAVKVHGIGKIETSREARLAFGSAGTVDQIYVNEGDKVSSGDKLAKLDTDALELALAQAKLTQATAEYNLDKALQVYTQSDITAARAAVGQVETYLSYAQHMLDVEANTEKQIVYWENEVYQAKINLAIAKQRLESMLPGGEPEEVTLGRQEVEVATQAVAQAQKQLDDATITAPFDGLVGAVYVKEGDVIPSPTTTIIDLIDPSHMELVMKVNTIDVPLVALDQEAIISVDTLPGTTFEGKVTSVGAVSYEVKVSFDVPPAPAIKTGMSASVDIVTNERKNVLLLHSQTIKQDSQGKNYVEIINGQTIVNQPVVIGLSNGIQTEIVSGLNEGDKVVIDSPARKWSLQ